MRSEEFENLLDNLDKSEHKEAPKLRTCRSATAKKSYDKKLEFKRVRTGSNLSNEIYLASPKSPVTIERRFTFKTEDKSQDIHHSDKFYSERELKILQKKLEDSNKFVSTD